jgi:hypothetical protein
MAGNKRPLFMNETQYGIRNNLATAKLDPFGNTRPHPMDAVSASTPEEAYDIKNAYENPMPTLLPRHLYAPEGARTVNFQKVVSVPAGGNVPLFSFTCLPGSTLVLFSYGLFSDAPKLSNIQWNPTVDGSRVLEYHGDPANNFFITEATGSGLSNTDLVPCQLLMEPGQKIAWSAQNNTLGAVQMGVRMIGYIDMSQRLTSSKFGD